MNKDQIKGEAKDLAGKVQRKARDLTDNHSQEAKGLAKQAEGKVQKGLGDAKEGARENERERQNRDDTNH